MNEKKYVVPEGMMRAFIHAENHNGPKWDEGVLRAMLTAALRWLSEKPTVPTPEQALAMSVTKPVLDGFDNWELVRWGACEWQRRMFLAPEPEIPEAVKDLLCDPSNTGRGLRFGDMADKVNDAILEAYRRGTLSHDEKKK